MATKEMLVEALSEFEGTMLFVSHDRHFPGVQLSNRVLELTPEGVHQYGVAGYTEYVGTAPARKSWALHPGA